MNARFEHARLSDNGSDAWSCRCNIDPPICINNESISCFLLIISGKNLIAGWNFNTSNKDNNTNSVQITPFLVKCCLEILNLESSGLASSGYGWYLGRGLPQCIILDGYPKPNISAEEQAGILHHIKNNETFSI